VTRDAIDYFLREIEPGDLPEINKWRNDASLVESLGAPFRYVSEGVDRAWFDHYMANRSTAVRLAVCESAGKKTVGMVYLTGIDWVARSGEFSIWIAAVAHRGKGAGTAASRGMLRHAFLDLNLHRLHLTVLADNEVARSLYRRLGFVEEGRLRSAAFKNGRFVDLVQMAMLSDEYRE
jgi:RimJ/RimL family protein N-acetyltransferase